MENSDVAGEWTLLSQEEASVDVSTTGSVGTENGNAKEEVLLEGAEDESGSNGSDIAIIDEEDDDMVRLASLQSSLLSNDSSFSLISASGLLRDGVEVLNEDLSDQTSSIQEGLAADVDLKPSVKHYIHTRNAHLNTILTVAVVLAITAVVGLGIGNFIGWSMQHQKHLLLSRSQVLKLKQLQDEIVLCMKQQQVASDGEELKVCYRDSGYWNQQFDALFEENHNLKGMLQQVKGESQSPLQCSSDATEEFHKLKLDLIVKQMEHLQVLKNLEEIKYQNMQSKERLKVLEEENTELKAKLEEEEQDDQLLVAGLEEKMDELKQENKELKDKLQEEMQDDALLAEMENKVHQLADENKDLKRVLEDIRRQVEDSTPEVPNSRATSLKQQVNDIVAENEDLKSTIARIRYGNPGERQKRHISHLVQENEDLKQEISKLNNGPDFATLPTNEEKVVDEVTTLKEHIKQLQEILQQDKLAANQWKSLYHEIKLQMDSKKDDFSWSELNWVDILKKGLQNGTEALTKVVNTIVHFISSENNTLKKDIFAHLNGSKIIFEAFQQNLINKWKELKLLTKSEKVQKYVGQTQKTIQKMSEALENSMKKLHQAGLKFVSDRSATQEGTADKLVNKVWKIVDNLEQKWTNLKDKWTEKVAKPEPQGPPQDKKTKEKDNSGQSKWYFRRARDREGMHARMKEDGKTEWLFKRAEAREQGHQTQQSRLHQDWYTRRGKSRSRNRAVRKKVNDESDDSSSCDDSSDSCGTYEFDSWKMESLLNEARGEHFDQEVFSHNIDKMYPGDA